MLPESLRKGEIFQDGKFLQILILSVSFMLLFTAFQTTCVIEKTVLNSVNDEDPSFTGDGYTSLCLIYGVFSIGSWLAPSIVAIIQSKWSMVLSAAVYLIFIAQFNYPTTWLLYLSSALLGGAASLLWCAQGKFLTLASDSKTISRNSGVFWAINSGSLFFGNLFVFFKFQGKDVIDSATRVFVFVVLSVVACCGVGSLFLLKNLKEEAPKGSGETGESPSEIGLPVSEKNPEETSTNSSSTNQSAAATAESPKSSLTLAQDALLQAVKLFITPNMLLLSLTSIYTGWGQCFFFGVYSTSVGATLQFEDAKRLVGLIGICTGIGEVAGGTVFGLLGSKTTKKGRSPVVFLGLLIHLVSYILIYLNLPENSPIEKSTMDVSVINPPQAWLAVFVAVLLGFGDACYQTQLFAMFGSVYSDKSAAAFAIFKFTQSAASAVAFFSSSYMGIFAHMFALLLLAVLGFLGFLSVEVKTKRKAGTGVRDVKSINSSESGLERSQKHDGNSNSLNQVGDSNLPSPI